MRDRLSTKILSNGATRYGVYDETGNLLRYEYIKLEDEPTVEGDLFSKANMLPDSIPALLGLKMVNPQVKDALNVLAHVGNLYVWERVQTYSEPVPEVPAGYTFGEVETDVLLVSKAGETSVSISYSDSISVDANGNVSLASVNTISYVISEWREHYSVLQGKFCQVMDSTSGGITDAGASIFFFPSDAILEYAQAANYKLTLTAKKYQSVTGYPYTPAIPAGTTTDYLTSTDRNAYPDNVTDAQDAYYTLGDVVVKQMAMSSLAENTEAIRWAYADSISVAEDGTISLQSPTARTIKGTESYFVDYAKEFIGKFAICYSDGSSFANGACYFFPSDATVIKNFTEFGGMPTVQMSKYQPVTGYAAIPANTTTITYLGQLGGGARIEVGSYVGTGTYGSSNPNSLTFGFEPKFVLIRGVKPSRDAALLIHGVEGSYIYWGYTNGSNYSQIFCTWNEKELSFYANNSNCYCNTQSDEYLYIAIG